MPVSRIGAQSQCPWVVVAWIALLASLAWPTGARGQASPGLEEIAGCYALEWQPWAVGGDVADSTWQTPGIEKRIWLTLTEIATTGDRAWFVVRPAPGGTADAFADVRWSWNEDLQSAVIAWDASMAGIRLTLAPLRATLGIVDSLEGQAGWWSYDAQVPAGLKSFVRASRQGCTAADD